MNLIFGCIAIFILGIIIGAAFAVLCMENSTLEDRIDELEWDILWPEHKRNEDDLK